MQKEQKDLLDVLNNPSLRKEIVNESVDDFYEQLSPLGVMEAVEVRSSLIYHISDLLKRSPDTQQKIISGISDRRTRGREERIKGNIIIAALLDNSRLSEDLHYQVEHMATRSIADYGLNIDDMYKQWDKTLIQVDGLTDEQVEERHQRWVANNLITMALLEGRFSEKDHAVQILHKDFGIHNFANRSVTDWEAQFRQKETSGPWALEMSGLHDRNGSFTGLLYTRNLTRAQDGLDRKYPVRYVEVDTHEDALFRAISLRIKYGRVKIPLVHMHSSDEHLGMGGRQRNQVIYKDDIEAIQGFLQLLTEEDSVIIVEGCSTGKGERSIAHTLATASGREVIAPTADSAINELYILQGEDGVRRGYVSYFNKDSGLVLARRFLPDGTSWVASRQPFILK